jgi:glycosyltransferase involved in cell wall biosynthesis
LRDAFRRAWVVASASLAEGWGLSLTEAAGCGTPAVATDIRGHRCSVVDGSTGVLVPADRLGDALADVLVDPELRCRLATAALARSRTLTWDASALGVLRVFHRVVMTRR